MTDEATAPTTSTPTADAPPKNKGGWPKGKARSKPGSSMRTPVHRTPVHTSRPEPSWKRYSQPRDDWDGEIHSPHENRFAIDQHVVDDLAREGVALQWFVESVMGQAQAHAIATAERNGWMRVGSNEIPGVGVVEADGLVLMARPMAIHRKALHMEKDNAREALTNLQQKHQLQGLPGVSGSFEARGRNYHRKSIEPISIPDGPGGRVRDGGGRFQPGK